MPPRKLTAKTGQKHEMEAFAEKYDTLALMYGDPVETVFAIMARNVADRITEDGKIIAGDDDVALRAADMLMSYRYARVKAAEVQQAKPTALQFNVIMPGANKPTIDVSPVRQMVTVVPERKP